MPPLTTVRSAPALAVEQRCALAAVALSEGRRTGVRLVSGDKRQFGLSLDRSKVQVPYPAPPSLTTRLLTCGVALQCAPSKELVVQIPHHELTARQRAALSIVEGGAAIGWISAAWPGLLPELRRAVPIDVLDPDLSATEMLERSLRLADSDAPLQPAELLGRLPSPNAKRRALAAVGRRAFGRMPWSTNRKAVERMMSVPVGGDGGVRNPNLPPASRPQDEEPVRVDSRIGVPYPEWNAWTNSFLPDHVAVLERRLPAGVKASETPLPDVRRWFQQRTHRTYRGGLEDGSDLDVDGYVTNFIESRTGHAREPRVFRDLVPAARDVATAVLLDGSSSLSVHAGRTFELELACADALSQAMTAARERHGVFVFNGNTRHRVDVRCLRDFDEKTGTTPSGAGLRAGGYTRLGAPLRHLTSRLLAQVAQRRLLIIIGDGLISDEGYEGRYAWADVAHALEEANDAGVTVFYLGVGTPRVDPLPEVFGARRSRRIRRVEELPRALAQVHRELVAA